MPRWLTLIALVASLSHALAAEPTELLPRKESNVSIRNEVELAIDKGLERLAKTQRDDGSWGELGGTGFALMAFQHDPRGGYLGATSAIVMSKGYQSLLRGLSGDLAALAEPARNIAPAWIALHASENPRFAAVCALSRDALRHVSPRRMEEIALHQIVVGHSEATILVTPHSKSVTASGSALAALVFMRLQSIKAAPNSSEALNAAAVLAEDYTLERTAGSGAHEYYFWLTMALTAIDTPDLSLPGFRQVDVARQLAEKLINDQNANGSWSGVGGHWSEKDPDLVTSYSLLALEAVYRLL